MVSAGIGAIAPADRSADQGIAECERGLAIDGNLPHAHALIGVGKTPTGRYEEVEAHVLEALRISPLRPSGGNVDDDRGKRQAMGRHDEEAVARLSRSIELDPNELMRHFYLAAALAGRNKDDTRRNACRLERQAAWGRGPAWRGRLRHRPHDLERAGRPQSN